jgi:hypothetical protein
MSEAAHLSPRTIESFERGDRADVVFECSAQIAVGGSDH